MKKIIINKENSKQRIDRFLVREFFYYTRGEIIKNIKNGNVLINYKKVKPSYFLKEKDAIEIKIKKESDIPVPNKKIQLNIIYKDKNLIAVNKPAGLQVHPSQTEKNNTLVNGLIVKFPEIKNLHDESVGSEARPGIVHRLDKDTSGIMVVARNHKTFLALKEKFKNREVEKKYLAVVHDNLKERSGKIEAPIARAASFKRQKVAKGKIKGTSKEAVTEYKVLKRFEKFDFVEVTPRTGRMHQIRVHFSYLGHPLVGDRKYARKNLKNPGMVQRHLLHAKQIEFALFGRKYFLEAPLARDFFQFLKLLDYNKIKS